MSRIYKAICGKILQQNPNDKDTELCCLCLDSTDANAISVNDRIILSTDTKDEESSEVMSRILVYTIGEKVVHTMSVFQLVCRPCAVKAIEFYKFAKATRDTIDDFVRAVDDLACCFDNIADTSDFRVQSLYVSVNPKDKTLQQFYDMRKQALPSETALARFHFIAYGTVSLNKPTSERRKKRVRDSSTIFIKTHELVADPSRPKDYKCKMCLKEYPTSGNLRQHFFSVHFKKEFQCNECDKSFGTSGLLQTHVHTSHKTVPCIDCGKLLLNRTSTIKRHAMTHLKSRKICNRCGRSYKKVTDFERHMAQDSCIVPSRIPGDYTCDTCGYHCNYKHQLLIHIKYEHTDAEGFICEWCKKKCYSASALKTHILKHTRERNFVCSECGGKFVTRQSLIHHTRLHTGERPYKCEHCDQGFLSASRRKDHMERYHIGETFDCDLCDAKYNARRSLVKHRKRHFAYEEA